jgi:transposase
MEVRWDRCAGIDLGKKSRVVCLRDGRTKTVRTYGTTTAELRALRDWLTPGGCEAVAMEATGSYWKSVWNVLEDQGWTLLLANPQRIKAIPGRKSDVRDAEWIAELLRHGLIPASVVPDRAQRELRELTRYRSSLTQDRAREVNRLAKVLEGGNIKPGSVLTDMTGKSGRIPPGPVLVRAPGRRCTPGTRIRPPSSSISSIGSARSGRLWPWPIPCW